MNKIACSILKADFIRLYKTLDELEKNNIEWIHYDVMDDHFVPNLSFGPSILTDISKNYNFKFDLHLMVETSTNINDYLKKYLVKGLKQITIHIEAFSKEHIEQVEIFCKNNNLLFSIALNPNTSIDLLSRWYNKVDNILVMSVQPGFGGQKFNPIVFDKIEDLKKIRSEKKLNFKLQIDGGVNGDNVQELLDLGIDWLVAGSWLTDDIKTISKKIKGIK